MQNLMLISFLGLSGILLRYGIDQFFANLNQQFPITTLFINLFGSLAAGTIYALSENRDISHSLQIGLLVGFCGGFTTFSAYTLQTLKMFEDGKFTMALAYLFLSPAMGLIMAFIPVLLVKKLSA